MLVLPTMALAMVPFLVAVSVMIALDIRIVSKVSCQKCSDRIVCIACNASIEFDPCFRQRSLRAVADPAADQGVHLHAAQKAGKRAVSITCSLVIWPSATS